MNRLRLILLAAALLAALLAAYLSAGLMRRAPQSQPAQAPVVQKNDTVDVVVAAKNLAQGEQLGTFGMEWRPWPRDGVTADMITKEAMPDALAQMKQARVRLPMITGEPIVAAKIVRTGDRGFMSAILPEGMRAISVSISDVSAVSGFILPNDRVDVILSRMETARNGDKIPISETVLTNVKVLAINQSLTPSDDAAAIFGGRTAVLELDPMQAEILAKIVSGGTLTLTLRSLAEGGAAGLTDVRPVLSESFQNPRRTVSGPLVIRYGLERSIQGR